MSLHTFFLTCHSQESTGQPFRTGPLSQALLYSIAIHASSYILPHTSPIQALQHLWYNFSPSPLPLAGSYSYNDVGGEGRKEGQREEEVYILGTWLPCPLELLHGKLNEFSTLRLGKGLGCCRSLRSTSQGHRLIITSICALKIISAIL